MAAKKTIIGIVTCKAKVSRGEVRVGPKKGEKWSFITSNLNITNDVGGTDSLPSGKYRVRLDSSFVDYETGKRCIGTLLDPADIEISRKHGVTGFTAEHYRKAYPGSPDLAIKAEQAAANFKPEVVYFSAQDFTLE